jgi:protein-tyrosine phosphatase
MKAEVYWIGGPWPGRLAILPHPRGGEWLEDEVQSLRAAGFDVLVSTLTSHESAELELTREAEICQAKGIEFVSFPIQDRGVPSAEKSTLELARRLEGKLAQGRNVGIQCRQGIGRSALLAACVLVLSGIDSETAFEKIQTARGCSVPDTKEQRQWVKHLTEYSLAEITKNRSDFHQMKRA